MSEKTLTIDMPEETFYMEGIQVAKRGIALDIQKFFPDLEETKFVETIRAPPKPAEAKPEPEAKPETEEKPAVAEKAESSAEEEKT
jgi:hypothetical protein